MIGLPEKFGNHVPDKKESMALPEESNYRLGHRSSVHTTTLQPWSQNMLHTHTTIHTVHESTLPHHTIYCTYIQFPCWNVSWNLFYLQPEICYSNFLFKKTYYLINGEFDEKKVQVQWTLIITDPFITDFGYNGHDFVCYFSRFCPLYPNFRKKIRFFFKSAIFYVFGAKIAQKCQFFL